MQYILSAFDTFIWRHLANWLNAARFHGCAGCSHNGRALTPSVQFLACDDREQIGGAANPATAAVVGRMSFASTSAAVLNPSVCPARWIIRGMRVPDS